MAPVLQCPDCGEKHPIARVPAAGAFACAGCGRVLKVPEAISQRAAAGAAAAPAAVPSAAPSAAVAATTATPTVKPVPVATAVASPSAPGADPDATRVVPGVDEDALNALSGRGGKPVTQLGRVPWWMRLLLWFVAVPLAFLVVFLIARAFGLFTSNQLSDVFLANNTSRFWPVARLLPFVALATATFVQGGVYLLARLRGRSRGGSTGPGVRTPSRSARA